MARKIITPREMDERLEHSLRQRCGVAISGKWIAPTSSTNAILDLNQAHRLVSAALAPAPVEEIEAALAILSVEVAPRSKTEVDAELTLTAYSRRLMEYPRDVALSVLRGWPTKSQWWPTWFELQEMCEERVLRRRLTAEALERGVAPERCADEPEPAPWEQISEEERLDLLAKRDAMISQLGGKPRARNVVPLRTVKPQRSPEEQMRALRDEGAA